MANPSKRKGTRGENRAVEWWREWFPHTERKALAGTRDCGDLTGLPFTVEIKSAERHDIPGWMRELEAEAKHNGKPGILMVKKSRTPWIFVLPEATMKELLNQLYRQ